jgi:hypothetical protein
MFKKYYLLLILSILSMLLFGYARAGDFMQQDTQPIVYLQSDLNRDGYVDLDDFTIFAGQWLNEADPNSI